MPDDAVERMREALPKYIGRLTLGERLSNEHHCGGSHDMPDGQPVYWQERVGEHPDDIDGYCLTCAIQQAESDAGWCECTASTDPTQSGAERSLSDYDYNELWDAIARATRIDGGIIAISVRTFRQALATNAPDAAKREDRT